MKKLLLILLICIPFLGKAQCAWQSTYGYCTGLQKTNQFTPQLGALDSFLYNGGLPISGHFTIDTAIITTSDSLTHVLLNILIVNNDSILSSLWDYNSSTPFLSEIYNYNLYVNGVQGVPVGIPIEIYPSNPSVLSLGLYDYTNSDWYLDEIARNTGDLKNLSVLATNTDSTYLGLWNYSGANPTPFLDSIMINGYDYANGLPYLQELFGTGGLPSYLASEGIQGVLKYTFENYSKDSAIKANTDTLVKYQTSGLITAVALAPLTSYTVTAGNIITGGVDSIGKILSTDISGETATEMGFIVSAIPANITMQSFRNVATTHTITTLHTITIFIAKLN